MADQVRIDRIDDITVVRMDRPPANALDLALVGKLDSALEQIEADGAGAVVLTGAGDFFSAGLDLKVVPAYSEHEQTEMILAMGRMIGRLYAYPRPTVAAVNGHAVAAGTLLTLACDYRIGTRGEYRFGLTGVQVGIPYPVAAQAIIEAELDPATRRNMLLGAGQFGPEEALEKGVLDELASADDVVDRAIAVARERSALPSDAYKKIKLQLRAAALRRISDANEAGGDPLLGAWMTPDSADASAQALDRTE